MPYIFIGLGAVALCVFCILRDKRSSIAAISVKTLASLFFVATAIASFLVNPNRQGAETSALLIVGGLVLGMIGDITLDFKIYLRSLPYDSAQKDSDNMTYVGMAAFGLGHILYIVACTILEGVGLNLLWSALVAIGLVGVIFGMAIGVMKMHFGKFLIPSVSYAFLLCWFVVYSIWHTAFVASTANILLLVGAIMFIVSDLILSMTYFSKPDDYKKEGWLNPESKTMIVANHVTYYIAQFLIALAILFF